MIDAMEVTDDVVFPDVPEADYEVFLAGETIDLVVPKDIAVHRDRWHSWFNDPDVVQHSDHGLWPNTPEKQLAYIETVSHSEQDRLVLLIRPKGLQKVAGVASLSNINWQHRCAQTAVVIGSRKRGSGALFQGLEAKAQLAEHAFDTMGLERVSGTQARPLADWQRFQMLFGFKVEGILRHAFRRGQQVHDLIASSCTVDDYNAVLAERSNYWPGRKDLMEMMRALPKHNPVDPVSDAIDAANNEYLSLIRS